MSSPPSRSNSSCSPQVFADELKVALSTYLNRQEPRTFKQEAKLRQEAIDKSFEAVWYLERAFVPGAQLMYWVEEYEAARLELIRLHGEMTSSPSVEAIAMERKALDRFANATRALAHQAASTLRP